MTKFEEDWFARRAEFIENFCSARNPAFGRTTFEILQFDSGRQAFFWGGSGLRECVETDSAPATSTGRENANVGAITSAIAEQVGAGCAAWPNRFPPEAWAVYRKAIAEAIAREIPFAVGGGLAAMTYARQQRIAKDIDLYVMPQDRERMIEAVLSVGLQDYYETAAYDRQWIFRSHAGEAIVDVMWAMANQRAQVDEAWLDGPQVEVDGLRVHLLPAEEALWSKLYVLQRDRCDWPDALNLVYGAGADLDWAHLVKRLGTDRPLLDGLLGLFRWMCPDKAKLLPAWLFSGAACQKHCGKTCAEIGAHRASLLDSRPWFTPTLGEQRDEL